MLRKLLSLSLASTLAVSTLTAQTPAAPPVKKDAVATKKTEPVYPKNPRISGLAEVEEFVLWPLRKEPHFVLKATNEALRSGDEKKATSEIQKAIAWLRLTESQATPEGKKELTEAVGTMAQVEADLKKGNTVDAAKVSKAIGTAYFAIANEHYLQAKQNHTGTTADKDSEMAAKHLIAAGLYLQEAARSANTQFSKDVQASLTALIGYDHPETDADAAKYGNVLAMHLKRDGYVRPQPIG